MKNGILLVSFGSTYEETRKNNIEKMATHVKESFGVDHVYQAYTSEMIRNILKKRDGIEIDNVTLALEKMKNDGITNVYIQPTHIIDGFETNKMKDMAENYEADFDEIKIGAQLLDTDEDYTKVALGLAEELKDVLKDNILLMMGHGTEHIANQSYLKLQKTFEENGFNNVFIFTVEGEPLIDDIVTDIEKIDCKNVALIPFMFVAGDHAKNDMAGDEEDSAKTILEEKGYNVSVIMKGLGEFDFIREIYVNHLKKVM